MTYVHGHLLRVIIIDRDATIACSQLSRSSYTQKDNGSERKAALNFRKVFAKKFCTKIICVFHRFSAQNILLSMRVSIYLSLHTYLSIFLYT